MSISDEIVRRALSAFVRPNEIHRDNLELIVPDMRAALEAVLPDLIREENGACAMVAIGIGNRKAAEALNADKAHDDMASGMFVAANNCALSIAVAIRSRFIESAYDEDV